jgi:hypothetical protein
MYKRPIPRARGVHSRQFVTQVLSNGALLSQWIGRPATYRIPTGHPSVVGAIIDKLRAPDAPTQPSQKWTPSVDYKFIAGFMPNPAEYIKLCEEWFEAHPQKRTTKAEVRSTNYNLEPINALFRKYSETRPPIGEHVAALREAGYPESKIEKVKQSNQRAIDTADERQRLLDEIFVKFPSASKPTPKPKAKKVIKVVKKKMPQNSNE